MSLAILEQETLGKWIIHSMVTCSNYSTNNRLRRHSYVYFWKPQLCTAIDKSKLSSIGVSGDVRNPKIRLRVWS